METTPEQAAEGIALVRVLATVLHRLVVTNASHARADPGQLTKFHALKAPGIGILQYLERIHKYATCSNECFILALIYIDRLIQRNNFLLTELNVHRVVITAVLVAAKFFDDAYYNNAYYAKVGGVLVSEMNGLEVDFLFRVNFSLQFTPDLFQKYRDELLSHAHAIMPPALQMMPVTSAPHGGVYVSMESEPCQPTSHPSHSLKRNYITPSPPAESAQPMPVNQIASDVHGLDNPYLQPVNALPAYPTHIQCSTHSTYTHNPNLDGFFSTEHNLAYPIHNGALVHPNRAKVEHGFHSQQHHHDPLYSDSNHLQYFITGQHVLTGCSSGN